MLLLYSGLLQWMIYVLFQGSKINCAPRYFTKLMQRKSEWSTLYRAGFLLRGHQTNNFAESTNVHHKRHYTQQVSWWCVCVLFYFIYSFFYLFVCFCLGFRKWTSHYLVWHEYEKSRVKAEQKKLEIG